MDESLKEKSYAFALRIVNLYRYLSAEKNDYVLSKQVLQCGTAIGAIVREAEACADKKAAQDILRTSLKEADETLYWLLLLKDAQYITEKMFASIEPDINELIALLRAELKPQKTSKSKQTAAKKKTIPAKKKQ